MALDMADQKTPQDGLQDWVAHIAAIKGDGLEIEVRCRQACECLIGDVVGGSLSPHHVATHLTKAAVAAGLAEAAEVIYPALGLAVPPPPKKRGRPKRSKAMETLTATTEDARPLIQLAAGHLARIASEAEDHLIAAGVPFYRRGNRLVRPVIETLPASLDRKTQSPRLAIVDDVYMRLALSKHIRWEKFDKRSDDWVAADPTKDLAATLNAAYGDWRFPSITGIIGTQTMRWDGSLILDEGYDERTGLILTDPPELPEMVDEPSRYDALNALALLKELLTEFPIVGVGSLAVALSALITPVVRAALDTAPLHATTAPRAGTGKSYVFDISAAISLGQLCPVIAAGKSEDEMEKRLGAALMGGQPIISIDNVNGELGGEMLCQAVERPLITPRILGKSEIGQVLNRATFFATGNNLVLLDDLTRRAVVCSLDSGVERPELRRFNSKPAHTVLAERGPYIAACLTIVRAYHLAGRPGRLTPLASFEAWSDMVRSALVWLGEDDPVATMINAHENDPVRMTFVLFVNAWAKDIGTGRNCEMTAAELVKAADKGQQDVFRHPLLREALHEIMPEKRLNSRGLGKWLARHENQICGSLKLMKAADPVHGHRWYLQDSTSLLL